MYCTVLISTLPIISRFIWIYHLDRMCLARLVNRYGKHRVVTEWAQWDSMQWNIGLVQEYFLVGLDVRGT